MVCILSGIDGDSGSFLGTKVPAKHNKHPEFITGVLFQVENGDKPFWK